MVDASADLDRDLTTGREGFRRTSRWQKVIGILGLVVVVWVGSQNYEKVTLDSGTGPGGHNPGGGGAPTENQQQPTDTDQDGGGGDTPPGGDGGGHTPPGGGHG